MDNLSRVDLFILREYEIITKQMQHEDHLRNYLLRYTITFFTLIISTTYYLFIKELIPKERENLIFIFLFLIATSILGIIIIIAKIRKAQLLWMKIGSNIRNYFYRQKYELYNITILSETTLRQEPNLSDPSQTLVTILIISALNSFYICSLIYLFLDRSGCHYSFMFLMILFIIFLLLLLLHYCTYKKFVTSTPLKPYSKNNPPWQA